MKTHKLYCAIKPYLAIGVTALCLTTFNASAVGHNHDGNGKSHIGQHHSSEQESHKRQMKKRFKMLAHKLDLTKAQRQEIRTIFTEMKADKKEHRATMSGFKEQVGILAQADEFDESKFKTLYAEFQDEFQVLAMEKAKMRHAIMQILTPEQQDKFSSMRKQRGSLF